ncbi:DUF6153 family protein, partial [Streptomyces sp. NPDC005047]
MTGSTGFSRRPTGRLFVLLVMAVLTGLLGMHALGPAGASAARSDTEHEMVMAQLADAPQLTSGCSHTAGGGRGPPGGGWCGGHGETVSSLGTSGARTRD